MRSRATASWSSRSKRRPSTGGRADADLGARHGRDRDAPVVRSARRRPPAVPSRAGVSNREFNWVLTPGSREHAFTGHPQQIGHAALFAGAALASGGALACDGRRADELHGALRRHAGRDLRASGPDAAAGVAPVGGNPRDHFVAIGVCCPRRCCRGWGGSRSTGRWRARCWCGRGRGWCWMCC